MFQRQSSAIFCIIAAEFCERFSFCGLRTILSLYLRNVLSFHENTATVVYHVFIMLCYSTPLMGAIIADNYLGRYRVILYFSIIFLIGLLLTCLSAIPPLMMPPMATSMIGLLLIAIGTGGIKPCVAAFGGDQFQLPEESAQLQQFFSTFYSVANLGGFVGAVLAPALRTSVVCYGDDACYALGFAFSALLMLLSIIIFVVGKPRYRMKQPRNATLDFVGCAWTSFWRKMRHDPALHGPPCKHWLDYGEEEYGQKLVSDMKVVCSILYLYLPVPIFWSLFDQQGSRWTFQASRLRSEVLGVTLLPDQLQVMNPAMVQLMLPLCPGGSYSLLPDLPPLHKMFIGGVLASLAFLCAGILQIGIERSTLQVPELYETGLVLLNTLSCGVEVGVRGAGAAAVGAGAAGAVAVAPRGTVLVAPLAQAPYALSAQCPRHCSGRTMKTHAVERELRTVPAMENMPNKYIPRVCMAEFMPIIIGQNDEDELMLYFMNPSTFSKSLTGKPKLKVVYIGDTGLNKSASIIVENDKTICEIYYEPDSQADHIGELPFIPLQPGKFKWRLQCGGGGACGWGGEGRLQPGGAYVLCVRARRGRLDAAALHAPNPPNDLHLLWILPQYMLVSVAEIMFAVSGLEFAFTQAPKNMKTITIAAWYMSVAFGNLIVILVTQAKLFTSQAVELLVYAGLLLLAMLVFLRMARSYQPHAETDDSCESYPLLRPKVISMLSLSSISTQPDGGGCGAEASARSASPCCERKRADTAHLGACAWPPHARVHVATPTSAVSGGRIATLAHD